MIAVPFVEGSVNEIALYAIAVAIQALKPRAALNLL